MRSASESLQNGALGTYTKSSPQIDNSKSPDPLKLVALRQIAIGFIFLKTCGLPHKSRTNLMFHSCTVGRTFTHLRIRVSACFIVSMFRCFSVSVFQSNTFQFLLLVYYLRILGFRGLRGFLLLAGTIYLIHGHKSWKVAGSSSGKQQIGGVKKPRSWRRQSLLGFE